MPPTRVRSMIVENTDGVAFGHIIVVGGKEKQQMKGDRINDYCEC